MLGRLLFQVVAKHCRLCNVTGVVAKGLIHIVLTRAFMTGVVANGLIVLTRAFAFMQ